jgi:hypothetical protein
MPSVRDSKRTSRVKSLGLKIDTKKAQDSYKTRLSVTQKAVNDEAPKLSEALANRNWRNHDDPVSMGPMITSAPATKTKFSIDEVKVKPQRHDEHDTIDYDRDLKRTAYWSKRPGGADVNLIGLMGSGGGVDDDDIPAMKYGGFDADLVTSAPATKTEFSKAEIGVDEQSNKYIPSVSYHSTRSMVRLDGMAPTKNAGHEKTIRWGDQQADPNGNKNGSFLPDLRSIAAVSPAEMSASSWEHIELPYAEMRSVNHERKFQRGLSHIEADVAGQLAKLVEPLSAGLPPKYLRAEYEERQKERKEFLAHNVDSGRKTSGTENRYIALIGKLQDQATRLRSRTLNDRDHFYGPNSSDDPENTASGDPQQRSASRDSGISGLSSGSRGRSSTLNPQAEEFHFTTQDQHPHESDSGISGYPVDREELINTKEVLYSDNPLKLLTTRVAELEAQLARQQSKKEQHGRQNQKWGIGNGNGHGNENGWQANKAPYGPKQNGNGRRGPHHPAMNRGVQGPTGYQVAQSVPVQPVPTHQAQYGAGGSQVNPMAVVPYQYGITQNGPGFPSNAMTNGFAGQSNALQPIAPLGVPAAPASQKAGFYGAAKSVMSTTPLWVKNMFGPKPVSKPGRPFRAGDQVQAMRQQQYEEYLEHLRATDPAYAMKCKQRQARRADRSRFGMSEPQ